MLITTIVIAKTIEQQLIANISTNESCETAYIKFATYYNKNHTNKAKEVFCHRFNYIQKYGGKLYSNSDLIISLKDNTIPRQKKSQQVSNCAEDFCIASDPLRKLKQVYKSVSLVEAKLISSPKDQGECGSCWAFGTTAIYENSILRQRPQNEFWSKSLDLSEQFLMSNIFSQYAQYCEGGNFIYATNYVNLFFKSVEKEQNVKYDPETHQNNWDQQIPIQQSIDETHYMKPFQLLPSIEDPTQLTPVIGLYFGETKFNYDKIWQVKSYLSRGIALSVSLEVNSSMNMFATYDGISVLHANCAEYITDHQVTLVGYGYKNGQEVWMLKNSWGEDWGANGYFFVPIGKDSFCMEHQFFAVLPFGLSYDEGIYDNIGTHERGLKTQLDSDINQLINYKQQNKSWIIWVSVISVIIVILVGVLLFIYLRKQKRQRSQSEYEPFPMRSQTA
ncbi:Cathepsin_L [Hexamita inflata]|uniref:Cathepsin L n=1 Tax=Hexamita inflata TaxID=28002 RepID=A0AA86NYN0_9EUKA|nr:Cathepsin L [Hexamita inflata]